MSEVDRMDTMLIAAGVCIVVVVAAIAAYAYLRRPRHEEEEDEGRKVTEDHIIAKMDTILRYQNADRP